MEEGLLEILGEAIEFVKLAAPELWALAWRQTYVYLAEYLLWFVMWTVSVATCIKVGLFAWRRYEDNTYNDASMFAAICLWAVAACSVAGLVYCLSRAIGYVVNPGYHCIKSLIDLIQ